MNSITSVLFEGFEWFMKLVKLNLLLLLTSIGGLLIFSFFPALVATFSVANQWLQGKTDLHIWRTYKAAFKKNYIRSQLFGVVFSLSCFILYIDIIFFMNLDYQIIKYGGLTIFVMMSIILFVTSLYVFPNLADEKLSYKDMLKNSLFTSLSFPHWTLLNILGVAGLLLVSYRFSASVFFLTGSTIILWVSCMSHIVNKKVEVKFKKMHGLID